MKVISQATAILWMLVAWGPATSGEETPDWSIDEQHITSKPVDEGTLQFLDVVPKEQIHHHQNTIIIAPRSLRDGWVQLEQCHHHLDPVARTDIVFKEGRVRNLKLLDYSGVGAVNLSEASIEMLNVQRDAWICLKLQSKALTSEKHGHYVLRTGPYMRRFLDGYFPMHLTMAVHYPCDLLSVSKTRPRAQTGFQIATEACKLSVDAWFRGRLNTEIHFRLQR